MGHHTHVGRVVDGIDLRSKRFMYASNFETLIGNFDVEK